MGWLFLDTHVSREIRIGWLEPGRARVRTLQGRGHKVLPAIEKWVRKEGKPDGICLVRGPGAFSAIRIGVLVGNLLARLWKKPLLGISVEEGNDVPTLALRLDRVETQDFASLRESGPSYVAPEYDAEPNITVPSPHVP